MKKHPLPSVFVQYDKETTVIETMRALEPHLYFKDDIESFGRFQEKKLIIETALKSIETAFYKKMKDNNGDNLLHTR